jgi:hypothetical protein
MLRDYMSIDKFEPASRGPNGTPSPYPGNPPWSTELAKTNAETAFVHNLMLYAGVGVYLPTKFSYKTPR